MSPVFSSSSEDSTVALLIMCQTIESEWELLVQESYGKEAGWMHIECVTDIGDPILSLCVYFPLLSICITWLPSVLVSSIHMWQFIFFHLSNHHYIYSVSGIVSYRIPPWSIVSDLSLAGFLNTLLEVFSRRTVLYTNHLPVSPSWGFPEKEQRLCNRFPKHQWSPIDTARISLFPSL